MKLLIPSAVIVLEILKFNLKVSLVILIDLNFLIYIRFNKNVINWLRIVARAAPVTPISNTNINIGYHIIFNTAP